MDRHDIEEIVRIVRLEYQRCMEGCGQTPAPADYKWAIEQWLLHGLTPQEAEFEYYRQLEVQ